MQEDPTILVLRLLLYAAVLVLVVLAVRYRSASRRNSAVQLDLRSRLTKANQDLDVLNGQIDRLQRTNERLAKYEVVVDADAKAAEILREVEAGRARAADDIAEALDDARQRAEQLSAEGRQIVEDAQQAREAMVSDAHAKAREIAGEALAIKERVDYYERAVEALRNIVDGYTDRYIVPVHSMLDDLADDFAYTDAGRELKQARDLSKSMIRGGTAATCEYVEQNRRETAVRFVIDAFNGKVDSILTRVKSDNAGRLSQEVRDAFTLVNLNGKAFRDSRITDAFLAARIDELKWAAVTHELRMQEREEQRRIKEQIREEERAQREYERAMREAAKEEDALRKAMAQAQKMADRATAEQRLQYEQQLAELSEKLRAAEDKNQRAISMAQQTRRGHVYIISNVGSFGENVYKIGLTRRLEPFDRIRELGDSSVPFEFDVHAMLFSEDAPALENQLHKHFIISQINKVNHRKEFFRVTLAQIRGEIDKLGLTGHWTMVSQAREYRESLAIEAAIESDPVKREAWLSRQLELDPVEHIRELAESAEAG